ncbi:peptidase S8/S53 domain-containing protein [Colletotrichum navitas]|uniref:Peptidase S8/S53 domain-containing protein n=1 Tax=Colletotrichum navitas TaxID=681940 RepID=A0AAD8PS97_9PEZI|nr:peptidase S8/S53 domain-containing protein [Colletotrichum navitas]KAK1579312.1 peptidase S8/S53 domain-containing protein [Colletotrichum navitas]
MAPGISVRVPLAARNETSVAASGAMAVSTLAVVGAGIGGFYTVNGVTAPIAAGASVVAGSAPSNPNDPPKSNDPESEPPASTTSSELPTSSTSSSAVPSATSADYIIFAKENTDKADGDGFSNTLAGLVGADNMVTIVNDADIPFIWRADLTADQLEKVKADRVIARADINRPLTRDDPEPDKTQSSATRRKRAEIAQSPIRNNGIFDLRTLSTPPKQKDVLPDYRYDDFAGHGITVYVVDTGPFDLQHEEFTAPSTDITRRELNVARNKRFSLKDTQHGTCVASKAVGVTTGVAKRANLVGVRIDFTEFGLLRGLQAAANEIKQKGLKGKAVVTTSILMRAPNTIYTTSMRSVIRGLISLDVPVVAAAGNKFRDGLAEPDKLPAVMAKEFPVIVVGSAGTDFKIAPTSKRGNLVTTYAIGANIKCADPLDQTGLATDSGTSFAAPQVAGMVAYWMSHPEFAAGLPPGSVAKTLRNMIATPETPTCNLCGAEFSSDKAGNLGGQVGCADAEVAGSACAANDGCKSWAFGNEDRGTYNIPVCLLFDQLATQIVSQAPPDAEGKCPFRYNDKACPVS